MAFLSLCAGKETTLSAEILGAIFFLRIDELISKLGKEIARIFRKIPQTATAACIRCIHYIYFTSHRNGEPDSYAIWEVHL
ncbi:MAG: hypothetical protein RL095_248 [Verrucomicrobiota bacterium]